MRQRARLPRRVERPHLGPRRQEPVDVVQVDGPRARALERRHTADLPVPPHRMAGAVEVRRRPARPLACDRRREGHDPPARTGASSSRPSSTRGRRSGASRGRAGRWRRPCVRGTPLPGTAVDPVAEPRPAVGGVVVRRRDGEPLARGPRARRRQAVHERRRRRARSAGRPRPRLPRARGGWRGRPGTRTSPDRSRPPPSRSQSASACGRCRDGQRCSRDAANGVAVVPPPGRQRPPDGGHERHS